MGDIRKMTTSDLENPEVRKHMELFWEAHDKLFVDMDNLTHDEFQIRHHEMWQHRNNASDIDGDMFLISCWGLSRKAHEIYGSECDPTT